MSNLLYNIHNLEKSRPGARDEKEFCLLISELKIRKGDKLAITGPSGCGKSTTLDILGLSLAPNQGGEFYFLNQKNGSPSDIQAMWKNNKHAALTALRLQNLGYVLQTGELLPYLTVAENMRLVARLAGKNEKDTAKITTELAERLDIVDQFKALPATLSVGQRQRAAIGRALVNQPPVILADEPTAALDPENAARVMEIFLQALDDFGSALILVTHNVEWATSSGLTQAPIQLRKSGNRALAILEYDSAKEGMA